MFVSTLELASGRFIFLNIKSTFPEIVAIAHVLRTFSLRLCDKRLSLGSYTL